MNTKFEDLVTKLEGLRDLLYALASTDYELITDSLLMYLASDVDNIRLLCDGAYDYYLSSQKELKAVSK